MPEKTVAHPLPVTGKHSLQKRCSKGLDNPPLTDEVVTGVQGAHGWVVPAPQGNFGPKARTRARAQCCAPKGGSAARQSEGLCRPPANSSPGRPSSLSTARTPTRRRRANGISGRVPPPPRRKRGTLA